jgi:hypothetical protein
MIVTKKRYRALENELKGARAELNLFRRILYDSSTYIINVMREKQNRTIGSAKALGYCETAALANLTFLEKDDRASDLNGTVYDIGRGYPEA